MRHLSSLKIGPLLVTFRSQPYEWEGNPAAGGERQKGLAQSADVTGPGDLKVEVAVVTWHGSREVAAVHCHGSAPRIQRLRNGGRIGVFLTEDESHEWLEIRVSRMTTGDWSSEFQTTINELTDVTQVPITTALISVGATAVGTRSELFAESNRRRNELAVEFPVDDDVVPVVAYCLARVLPLLRCHGQGG